MWGKPKAEPATLLRARLPCPRAHSRERGLELVLRYIERMLGYPMSAMDAEVLVTLIRAANEEGRCDDGAGTEGTGEAGEEVSSEG